jgi:hypothetical protein
VTTRDAHIIDVRNLEGSQHQASQQSWAAAAQEQEFAFHEANRWRRSPQFALDSASLWRHFGFRADQFRGQTIIDFGAGSRLRTRYFEDARVIAIEPLADRFRRLEFSDLGWAAQCFSAPGEVLQPTLVGVADAVVSINALDHGYDFDTAVRNIAAYLKPHAGALLSFDLHDAADDMHPLLLTEPGCRRTFAASGLAIVHVNRGLGEFGAHYGHGEAINFWLLKCGIAAARTATEAAA